MHSMIKIRKYKKEDAAALASIYYRTIHIINIRDYSEAQVNVWGKRSDKYTYSPEINYFTIPTP